MERDTNSLALAQSLASRNRYSNSEVFATEPPVLSLTVCRTLTKSRSSSLDRIGSSRGIQR